MKPRSRISAHWMVIATLGAPIIAAVVAGYLQKPSAPTVVNAQSHVTVVASANGFAVLAPEKAESVGFDTVYSGSPVYGTSASTGIAETYTYPDGATFYGTVQSIRGSAK